MNQTKDLKLFIWSKIFERLSSISLASEDYRESINEDALTDKWIDNNTSWMWKVGVFTLIDSNKCDFVHVFIGMQRAPMSLPEFVGELHFHNGENDDIARVISRAVGLLKEIHPVFDPEL